MVVNYIRALFSSRWTCCLLKCQLRSDRMPDSGPSCDAQRANERVVQKKKEESGTREIGTVQEEQQTEEERAEQTTSSEQEESEESEKGEECKKLEDEEE